MGKPTGFMDYERQDKPAESPLERIKHFNEFHTPLSKEEQELQGARCMACGVPFCQSGKQLAGMASGCPLHNLVPEWNDLIYNGNWKEAYLRLKKTNRKQLHQKVINMQLLKMHMRWDMQRQIHRKCVQERKSQ